MPRSWLLHHARVLPARDDGADAVLVRDGRIAAVGRGAELAREAAPDIPRVDLRGRVLLPGFQDAHFHFLQFGRVLSRPSLAGCRSREAWLAELAEAHARTPEDRPLFAESWDETDWPDPARPCRAHLDAISRRRPIVARRICGHFAVANESALALLAERWSGAGIDPALGHVDEEPALALDELFPPDDTESLTALDAAARACLALGITTACDFLRARALEAYRHALDSTGLGLRITAWVLEDCIAGDGTVPRDPGPSDRFVVRGLKIFGDGTIGGRTAALTEDYADRPGERGRLLVDAARMRALVTRMHDAGRPVAIHAIGDRAIRAALDAFAARPASENAARGHRIEHLELPGPGDIDRLATLGVRPCVQPNFLRWAGRGGLYETALGRGRLARMNPFRTLRERGARPFFGSDGMPASPYGGIRSALRHPVAAERLDVETAVRLYTEDAATPGRPATGRLVPGEPADLAVFPDTPDRTSRDAADLTWLGGELVHGSLA